MKAKSKALRDAHVPANGGSIDYSSIAPRDKWEVLDDLESVGGASKAADAADLGKIRPFAQKFGVMGEFRRKCEALGVRL